MTWKYCRPSYRGTPQIGLDVTQIKNIVNPLPAGFPLMSPTENTFGGDPDRSPLKGNPPFRGTRGPHKMYILRGAPFGARAQATALRHLCGAANYATCNAPASRRDGALLAYRTSCPTRLTRCARNNRWTFGSALCPCPMCKSGVPAKNLQGFFVGYFLAGRLQLRISVRRV